MKLSSEITAQFFQYLLFFLLHPGWFHSDRWKNLNQGCFELQEGFLHISGMSRSQKICLLLRIDPVHHLVMGWEVEPRVWQWNSRWPAANSTHCLTTWYTTAGSGPFSWRPQCPFLCTLWAKYCRLLQSEWLVFTSLIHLEGHSSSLSSLAVLFLVLHLCASESGQTGNAFVKLWKIHI